MSKPSPKKSVTVNLAVNPKDPGQKIVKAALLDKKEVDLAVQRQVAAEAAAIEKQRRAEEQVLAQQRKAESLKKEALAAARAVEAANAQKLQLEAQAKQLAESKAKLEQEQNRMKKQIAEQQLAAKKAQEKKGLEQATKKKILESQAQAAGIKANQDRLAQEHQEFLASEIDKYRAAFQSLIEDNRILSGVFNGDIICKLRITLLPDGSIANVAVVASSGNPAYDEMSAAAVYKSAPFPMPSDQELYNQLRDIVLSFRNGDSTADVL